MALCPSVCLSVYHKPVFCLNGEVYHHANNATRGALVFWRQRFRWNSDGMTPSWGAKAGGAGKNCVLRLALTSPTQMPYRQKCASVCHVGLRRQRCAGVAIYSVISSFSVAGPTVWNSLPAELRCSSTYSSICNHLKTILATVQFAHCYFTLFIISWGAPERRIGPVTRLKLSVGPILGPGPL